MSEMSERERREMLLNRSYTIPGVERTRPDGPSKGAPKLVTELELQTRLLEEQELQRMEKEVMIKQEPFGDDEWFQTQVALGGHEGPRRGLRLT